MKEVELREPFGSELEKGFETPNAVESSVARGSEAEAQTSC